MKESALSPENKDARRKKILDDVLLLITAVGCVVLMGLFGRFAGANGFVMLLIIFFVGRWGEDII